MKNNEILRGASLIAALAALLMASSCASPADHGVISDDGVVNHPITVAPHMAMLQLAFATPASGLMPQDEARFENFVGRYLAAGNGAISITPPSGPGAQATVRYFGERLAAMGVPRSRIMVGTAGNDDPRVALRFITYNAQTSPCGDWSEDMSSTASNLPPPNFGCATQHNLAAMVADPRDLVEPRAMGPSDATRRETVMQSYEAGKPTSATKSADQSVAVSDVQ